MTTPGEGVSHVEEYEGVLMWGGEMPTWSDQASLTGPFRSPLGPDLVASVASPGCRVLVVGPHSYEVLEDLADRASDLHILVRSWPDAQALRERPSLDRTKVHCGSFTRFDPGDGYDLVVALDGLARIQGVDDPPTPWSHLVKRLSDLVRTSGQALLAVHNDLGLQQIVSSSAGHAWRDGMDWASTSDGPDSSMNPADLPQRCEQAGFHLLHEMAVFPNTYTPTLIASHSVLRRYRGDEHLGTMVSQAFNHEIEVRSPLKDPRVLARRALKAGLAPELAAGWILYLAHGAATSSGGAATTPPPVMFAEADESTYWGIKYSVTPVDDGTWSRALLPSVDLSTRKSESIVRSASRLNGAAPNGVLLEERLAEACGQQDIPALRRTLQKYTEWLTSQTHMAEWTSPWVDGDCRERALLPGGTAFAVFDNVVISEDQFALLDPSWEFEHELPVEVVVLRAFRRFAQRLVVGGYEHPWPFGTSPAHISKSMGAMVGIETTEELRYLVAALEAELTDDVPTWSATKDRSAQVSELDAVAERPLGRAGFVGHDEAMAAIERLTAQLAETEEQVDWLIRRIHRKQMQLRKARAQRRQLKRSREYQLGASILGKREAVAFWRRKRDELDERPAGHLWKPPKADDKRQGWDPELLPPGRRPIEDDPDA